MASPTLYTVFDKWGKMDPQTKELLKTPQGFYKWLDYLSSLDKIFPATQAEVDAGIIDNKFVSPLTLNNWIGAGSGGGSSGSGVVLDLGNRITGGEEIDLGDRA